MGQILHGSATTTEAIRRSGPKRLPVKIRKRLNLSKYSILQESRLWVAVFLRFGIERSR